jgi:hypothetical protein
MSASSRGIAGRTTTTAAAPVAESASANETLVIDRVFELESAFYQFRSGPVGGITLVVYESGLLALSDGGEEVWTLAIDVIKSADFRREAIRLEFLEGAPVSVSPMTGRPVVD